jgi:hypothetical protein
VHENAGDDAFPILEARRRGNQAPAIEATAPRTPVADGGFSSRYAIRPSAALSLRHAIRDLNAEKGLTRKSAPCKDLGIIPACFPEENNR